jgi:hypothetical protein
MGRTASAPLQEARQEGVMIRKYRGSERGMSAIPFVVALLLLAIAIVAWYKADQEATELRGKLNANAQAAGEWQKKFEKENTRLLELTEVTGFGDAEGKPDKAAIQAALNGGLESWREKYSIEFTADKYTATGQGGMIEKLPGDKIRVIYVPAKDQISNPSLQSIQPIFHAAAARMQNDIKRAFEEKAAEVKSKAEMLAAKDKALADKDALFANLKNEADQTKRTFEEQVRELRDQVQAKDAAIQAAQAEAEAVKAEKDKAVAALSGEVNQKAAEIQTLVRRERPYVSEGPDGSVLASGNGVVVLDRGRRDMLMPGTVFKVLGRIKGGELVQKGVVKVIVCNEQTADCRVVDENPSNPITGGDLVQSETYSPNRQMRFVLIGEFRKMGRSQAESRLKQLGAAIETSVTTETHYLVVGTPAAGETLEDSDAYKRAREYGVQILTEAELASFTMY